MDSNATRPARRLLHTREIVCQGYLRDDGMLDVESTMRDISPNGSDLFFKPLGAGEDLHRMRIAMTVDMDLVIRDIEVHTEAAPTPWCAGSNANYDALKGLTITGGFTKKVRTLVGGSKGCTHLTELMGPAATTAMQTWHALRRERGGLRATLAMSGPMPKPALADTCQAYRSGGEALNAIWPLERRAQ
ncbi:DUF2889 domain-containing protein [Variovorax sp. J22R133]|uniref:DUF2889 domain-containing protein n=1 Tax=Variovorax brevis TaxID=3053503 RepID=UPI002575737A|nr:DUF2889 domain-containing protein [Variovorax sp. J22R133]MDM0113967.1 DUF2889 domain-containing protein [Variovorax sp. J22R133]